MPIGVASGAGDAVTGTSFAIEAVEFARNSPEPGIEETYLHVFMENQ